MYLGITRSIGSLPKAVSRRQFSFGLFDIVFTLVAEHARQACKVRGKDPTEVYLSFVSS